MSKHTPGPWIIEGPKSTSSGHSVYEIVAGDQQSIADLLCGTEDEATCVADAKLIAAAPALLAAAERVMVRLGTYRQDFRNIDFDDLEAIGELRRAIKLARGVE